MDSSLSVTDFNVMMKSFFEKQWLIGVSLKKVGKKTTAKLIDVSSAKPFKLDFASTQYNIENTYWDIQTKGFPERFMIRARAKAKSITTLKDLKIYFEGKLKNSTEFLGAIPTNMIKSPGSDTVAFDVTEDIIKDMNKKVESHGFMKVKNVTSLSSMDEMKKIYVYVMLRYADSIYSAGKDNLQKLGRAGFKLNDFSSIHYKVGG